MYGRGCAPPYFGLSTGQCQAVLVSQRLQRAVVHELLHDLIDLCGHIGILAEANAVLFRGQADTGCQVSIAGAFAGHGVCHGDVDDAGIRGAGGNFHQGSALILQTYYACLLEEFQAERENLTPPEKKRLFGGRKKTEEEPWWQRLERKNDSCFLCDRLEYHMERYYHTFFHMVKDAEFRDKVSGGKGFCMRHFARLLKEAEEKLPNAQRDWFYDTVPELMEEHLIRVKEDLDWLIAKYDYRNAGADWKNSRDALQRTMQKLEGIYPADPPYKPD